jgi:hypothetical protein
VTRQARRSRRLVLGLLLGLVCLLVPASGAAALSTDANTPSTPSPDQIAAEASARAAQPSPAASPVTTPASNTADGAGGASQDTGGGSGGGGGCFLGICDPGSWLKDQVNAIVSGFLKDLVSNLTSAVASFFDSLNFITRTPQELSYQEVYVTSSSRSDLRATRGPGRRWRCALAIWKSPSAA